MNALTTQANTAQLFPIGEVQQMARAIASSGLFGVKTPDQAFALMLIAQAEGRHPATVAQDYDIIQGRPALKAQSALARFQAAGGKIQWTERSDKACAAELSHPAGGTLAIRWDIHRAQAAGLTGKDNWKKFPAQMLAARVVAEGVRAVFPACLNGVYLAEEVQDFDPPKPRHGLPAAAEVAQEPDHITSQEAGQLYSAAVAVGMEDGEIYGIAGTVEGGSVTREGAKALADEIRRRRNERANKASQKDQAPPAYSDEDSEEDERRQFDEIPDGDA